MKMGWDVRVDDIFHKIPFMPRPIKDRVCDWLERRLGVTPEEMVRVKSVQEEKDLEDQWYTEYQSERYKNGMGQ